jgi:hypothetical protein
MDSNGLQWPGRAMTDGAVNKLPRLFVAMRGVHRSGFVRRGNASRGPAGQGTDWAVVK